MFLFSFEFFFSIKILFFFSLVGVLKKKTINGEREICIKKRRKTSAKN